MAVPYYEDIAFKTLEDPVARDTMTLLIERAREVLPRQLYELLTATLNGLAYSCKIQGAMSLLGTVQLTPTSMMSVANLQAFAISNRREPIGVANELVTIESVFGAFLALNFALVLGEEMPPTLYLNNAQNQNRTVEFPQHEFFDMLELTAWCCDDCETVQNEYPCLGCPPSGFEAE